MKLYYIIAFFQIIISFAAYGQTEILDSVQQVINNKTPELAEKFCTSDYWNNDFDNGIKTFNILCSPDHRIEIELIKEQKKDKRAVLTVDIRADGELKSDICFFLIREPDKWLIDGFSRAVNLTNLFLDGNYSGHFSPVSLPRDDELLELGNKILSFDNEEELLSYLKENTASGSTFDFTDLIISEVNVGKHLIKSSGYEDQTKKGYIYFTGKQNFYDHIFDINFSLYLVKTENGVFKIHNWKLDKPYVKDFLSY